MKRTAIKRKVPVRRASRHRATVVELDALWSRVVRQRAGNRCIIPGCNRGNLQGCHIFPKSYPVLRHDPDNGFAACWYHHLGPRGWHKDPEAQESIKALIGAERIESLRFAARTRTLRPDREAVRLALEAELGGGR